MKNNDGIYISTNSVLCEYKERYSYDKNFLTDEIMKQVIANVGEIIIDRLIRFAENGIVSSNMLVDTFDPSPEDVPHDGDPIGRRGPNFDQIGWAGAHVFSQIKDHLEFIKTRL